MTDKQVLALREVLKPLYVEQRQMMAELFSGAGDFQAMRQEMREQQSRPRHLDPGRSQFDSFLTTSPTRIAPGRMTLALTPRS